MLPPELRHGKLWKYAKPEFERRFLISQRPAGLDDLRYKDIEDKYLDGTRLRIRKINSDTLTQYKLTKKLAFEQESKPSHWISTLYLSQEEYLIFCSLTGFHYQKRRFYVDDKKGPTIGMDQIDTKDGRFWLAEVEFSNESEMIDFQFPLAFDKEVTMEEYYSGFEIAKRALN